jgi:hypothetical protein
MPWGRSWRKAAVGRSPNHPAIDRLAHEPIRAKEFARTARLSGMSVLPSIVLQKSQKAQRLISRQRTKRATIADQ